MGSGDGRRNVVSLRSQTRKSMWIILAFVSATFLGFYDISKKAALKDNAVLPVLLLNTIFSTLIFSPLLIDYLAGGGWFEGTFLDTAPFNRSTQQFETQELTPVRGGGL